MKHRRWMVNGQVRRALLGLLTIAAGANLAAQPKPQIFALDEAGFGAAAGVVATQTFDRVQPGTDLSSRSVDGVRFEALGARLEVVVASKTHSVEVGGPEHKLVATSGSHVLSPGGRELTFVGPLQRDSFRMVFEPPVTAVGFDLLWQSADPMPYTRITVRGAADAIVWSGSPEVKRRAGSGPPGSSDFWGIVSADRPIHSVQIDELDDGAANPDSNIGLDTLRTAGRAALAPGGTDSTPAPPPVGGGGRIRF